MATGSVFIEQVNVRAFIAGSGALMRSEIPHDTIKKLYIMSDKHSLPNMNNSNKENRINYTKEI